MHISKNT